MSDVGAASSSLTLNFFKPLGFIVVVVHELVGILCQVNSEAILLCFLLEAEQEEGLGRLVRVADLRWLDLLIGDVERRRIKVIYQLCESDRVGCLGHGGGRSRCILKRSILLYLIHVNIEWINFIIILSNLFFGRLGVVGILSS